MKKKFKDFFCATAIGSVPHADTKEIVEKIFGHTRNTEMMTGRVMQSIYF